MANTSEVAARAAVPTSAEIERAAEFAREPFLLDGEGPEALAEGTARRRALDAALAEIEAGAEYPSIQWRRDFSLLLGHQLGQGAGERVDLVRVQLGAVAQLRRFVGEEALQPEQ